MNSQKPSSSSSSTFNSYQFDFGFTSSSSQNNHRPLKDQKPNHTSFSAPKSTPAPSWAPQQPPKKPSWTHQPLPTSTSSDLAGPTSMVGDIFGKSWGSATPNPTSATPASIGIVKSNPNLFGDLVGSALNQGKNQNNNAPLKSVKNSYSMGSLINSLPTSNSGNVKSSHSAENFGKIGGGNDSFDSFGAFSNLNQSSKNIGGKPMNSRPGVGSNNKKDPFGSLMDFGANKPVNSGTGSLNSDFGSFQNVKVDNSTLANNSSNSSFGVNFNTMPAQKPMKTEDFSCEDFKTGKKSDVKNLDPLDMLFGSSSNNASNNSTSQQFGEMNEWEVEFGSGEHNEATTELEGLPPPPSGVTSSVAKSKGMDNYKQGQFADAIKWLSWAVVLIEKGGDSGESDEVLTCRASCYKEVGEYKKAVADCTKVLEHDSTNVSVLLQRALLYESTEKYRLGADDLRTVLKIDPGNRLAKSTIHRLNKMAG